MTEWQPIKTAPRDGSLIVVWGQPSPKCEIGPYVVRWSDYGVGSMAHAAYVRGDGPRGTFWHYEPIHNWTNGFMPTHWIPLPDPPK